jgi:hypothetical protein
MRHVLAGVVAAVGLYQAGVPLIARGVFGAEQRLAPAAALPAPWWWLTCAALAALTALVLLALAPGDAPAGHSSKEVANPAQAGSDEAADQGWDALSGFIVLVALYNGLAPFVVRLVFHGDRLLLALPLHLPGPWWWIVAGSVIVAAAAALVAVDRARDRSDDV